VTRSRKAKEASLEQRRAAESRRMATTLRHMWGKATRMERDALRFAIDLLEARAVDAEGSDDTGGILE
jgi:hypothetical protein